jgi:uncharacterized protein YecT (DUF1311 family)
MIKRLLFAARALASLPGLADTSLKQTAMRLYMRAWWLGLLVCLLMSTSMSFAGNTPPVANELAWVLDYAGDSANPFVWDKRTLKLIQARVPSSVSKKVLDGLSGPPNPFVVLNHRYASTSACRAHSCMEKGFIWIDTLTGHALGAFVVADLASYLGPDSSAPSNATLLQLGSNSFGPEQLPREAKQALISWLSDENIRVDQVEFFHGSGAPVRIDDVDLKARPTFIPPAGGPAFDCAHASNNVERTICSDTGLAAQDLALSKLYNQIRLGSGTQYARQQLQQLQRQWLKQRDRDCASAASSSACLGMHYAAQTTVLRNWVPAAPPRSNPR